MSVVLHWFLPTVGRQPHRGAVRARRPPPAADASTTSPRSPGPPTTSASTGVLTPTGTWCEDAWLVTAALLRETKRLKFLVAFRPELDLADAGRAEGGDVPADLRRPAAAEHRHRRRATPSSAASATGSTTTSATTAPTSSSPVLRGALSGRAARLRGSLLPRRRGDRQPGRPTRSAAVLRRRLRRPPSVVAARHVDVYLDVGRAAGDGRAAPRPDARARRRARAARCASASACTSSPATGPRTPGPRPSGSSTPLDPAVVAAGPGGRWPRAQSVGQQRMVSLHGGSRDDLVVAPEPVGRLSGSCAAAPARRSSAATRRSPTASRSTTSSASTSSSSPATRTSRRPTGSARASCRSCAVAASSRAAEHRPAESALVLGSSATTNAR